MKKKNKIALVTGCAGFIGYHFSKLLLTNGWSVVGIDSLNNYYDVSLKKSRLQILKDFNNFNFYKVALENTSKINELFKINKFFYIYHFAAQAGVRYSLNNTEQYINSNIKGTVNLLENCKNYKINHFLIASTSSVYGNSLNLPFAETHKTDYPISLYAATKKSVEVLSHSYSHLYKVPITIFRFFTVYGPWGRPDMALFKFTNSILKNEKIDVFNFGNMERDFTYIDDIIYNIYYLTHHEPAVSNELSKVDKLDNLSQTAPYRIINIGNSQPVNLLDFIKIIEKTLKKKAKLNMLPLQKGDLIKTWSNNNLLKKISGKEFITPLEIGVQRFLKWYKDYYKLD